QDLCIILHRRIAPCEVLAGFDTCHNTPPFKSRHHPNSVITRRVVGVIRQMETAGELLFISEGEEEAS
ncbi:MAG: hypothetical protein ACI9KK_002915, partial [Ascidiaceihabitans sp.]